MKGQSPKNGVLFFFFYFVLFLLGVDVCVGTRMRQGAQVAVRSVKLVELVLSSFHGLQELNSGRQAYVDMHLTHRAIMLTQERLRHERRCMK